MSKYESQSQQEINAIARAIKACLGPDTMPGSYLDDAFECDIVGTVVIKGGK